jgi:hypothetical protein
MTARKRKPARKGKPAARPANAEPRRFGTPNFAAAYTQWIEARAGIDRSNVSRNVSKRADAQLDALLDLEGEALWELIRHPAASINEIRARAEVLMHECRQIMEAGRPRDNHLPALAAALCRDLNAASFPGACVDAE